MSKIGSAAAEAPFESGSHRVKAKNSGQSLSCPQCSRTFTATSHLNIHVKYNHPLIMANSTGGSTSQHVCPQCQVVFASQNALDKHICLNCDQSQSTMDKEEDQDSDLGSERSNAPSSASNSPQISCPSQPISASSDVQQQPQPFPFEVSSSTEQFQQKNRLWSQPAKVSDERFTSPAGTPWTPMPPAFDGSPTILGPMNLASPFQQPRLLSTTTTMAAEPIRPFIQAQPPQNVTPIYPRPQHLMPTAAAWPRPLNYPVLPNFGNDLRTGQTSAFASLSQQFNNVPPSASYPGSQFRNNEPLRPVPSYWPSVMTGQPHQQQSPQFFPPVHRPVQPAAGQIVDFLTRSYQQVPPATVAALVHLAMQLSYHLSASGSSQQAARLFVETLLYLQKVEGPSNSLGKLSVDLVNTLFGPVPPPSPLPAAVPAARKPQTTMPPIIDHLLNIGNTPLPVISKASETSAAIRSNDGSPIMDLRMPKTRRLI